MYSGVLRYVPLGFIAPSMYYMCSLYSYLVPYVPPKESFTISRMYQHYEIKEIDVVESMEEDEEVDEPIFQKEEYIETNKDKWMKLLEEKESFMEGGFMCRPFDEIVKDPIKDDLNEALTWAYCDGREGKKITIMHDKNFLPW